MTELNKVHLNNYYSLLQAIFKPQIHEQIVSFKMTDCDSKDK